MKRYDPYKRDPEIERQRKAYHESGHAVAMWASDIPIVEVAICAEAGYADHGQSLKALTKSLGEHAALELLATINLAGQAAQIHWQWETRANGCDSDRASARHYVERLMGLAGDQTASDLTLEPYENRAAALVDEHWLCVTALANALLEQDKISGDDAVKIIGGASRGHTP